MEKEKEREKKRKRRVIVSGQKVDTRINVTCKRRMKQSLCNTIHTHVSEKMMKVS